MPRIIGIDLGTTYSAVSVWDEKRKMPVIVNNLRGSSTTPSIVSLNEAGEVIVGEDARQNFLTNPKNTVSQIKREMGTEFKAQLGGETYNPQTISAFILRYLKQSAETVLGEPIHDAVITVPAYFTEVQMAATRDAGKIAGLNVLRLINEPTAAAVAYGVNTAQQGDSKTYAVYDFGGGTFDVSIIEITPSDVTVVGTGGDSRLGGLDMDETVAKWAIREITNKHGIDLNGDDAVFRRLKYEAENIKKTLVTSENATLSAPFLTVVNGQPLNVSLQISRARFEMLVLPLLNRSLAKFEEAVESATKRNGVTWADLSGVLLVGGPTRLRQIRDLVRDLFKKHIPDRDMEIRSDMNPDEVVAMGAAIVAAGLKPIGLPPEEVETKSKEEVASIQRGAEGVAAAPAVDIVDVTGHSLGIAVEGFKMHTIIEKESVIPVTKAQAGFTNMADGTTELVAEIFQGENEFVAANTRIGVVRISGLDPMPAGTQNFEVRFTLDINGTLSTVCTDLRTRKTYEGSFTFDGFQRMDAEEIRRKRAKVAALMAGSGGVAPAPGPAGAMPSAGGMPASAAPVSVPSIDEARIPADYLIFWKEAQSAIVGLSGAKQQRLAKAMTVFASTVMGGGSPGQIENAAFDLQDALIDVRI